jgi:hypothetical protein
VSSGLFIFQFTIKFVLISPIRPFPRVVRSTGKRSKPGFTFSDYGHLVRNNTIVTSPYQINIRTTATRLRRHDGPRNFVVVVSRRGWDRVDKLGRGLLLKGIVTYAYIGALSRFGCTVFHGSPPFYSTMPAYVLRGQNHKRCRGNNSRQGP